LEHFDKVIDTFGRLKPKYQDIISDITKEMGYGMSKYLQKQVVTLEDWEEYCHYVAGVVGLGLSRIFANSGLEDPRFATVDTLSNSMGLYLQKTNIVRDYLDDISQKPPRIFYPKNVWSKYAENIEDFGKSSYSKQAVTCLNELITDTMKHSMDCLDYIKMIKEPSIFKFCAIPQVMAIATLELCYNNPNVFRWEVKIRKGEAVQLILSTTNYQKVCECFYEYTCKFESKIPSNDPNSTILRSRIKELKERCLRDLNEIKATN